MPAPLLSQLNRIQRDAQRLLLFLHKDIQVKDAEFRRLKTDESRLTQLVGTGAPAATGRRTKRSGRVNWRALLAKLPKEFKVANVHPLPGLTDRRSSEIFAASRDGSMSDWSGGSRAAFMSVSKNPDKRKLRRLRNLPIAGPEELGASRSPPRPPSPKQRAANPRMYSSLRLSLSRSKCA
jgi:hypothetical protein